MKFLKCAVACWVGVVALPASADEEFFDFEKIWGGGKLYQDILVLEADEHGLMFRHREGIAKLPFTDLSMNLRMLYEPVEDVPGGVGADAESGEVPEAEFVGPMPMTVPEPSKGGGPAVLPPIELTLVARTRITYPIDGSSAYLYGLDPALLPGYRAPWRSHWGRYPRPLSLANPAFRELALRDFLLTTGLHPASCRIHPYPIPQRVPCLPYVAPLPW